MTSKRTDILRIVIAPFPTSTSAVPPGSYFDPTRSKVEAHRDDLSHRLKSTIYLIGGLTAALLSQKGNMEEHPHLDRETTDTLSTLVNGLKAIACYLLENNHSIIGNPLAEARRQRRVVASTGIVDKPDVKAALELVPPLVIAIVLFEDKMEKMRRRQRTADLDSWDFVEEGADPSADEQMSVLTVCQEELSNLAGVLVARAMLAGGGEASTLVWRAIISSFDSAMSNSTLGNQSVTDNADSTQDEEQEESSATTQPESSSVMRTNLLCRLTAIVLNLIVLRRRPGRSNPWESVELCSSTARLCDFVEEKKLLQVSCSDKSTLEGADFHHGNYQRLTLDQVLLLCALLNLLETGRENTGWCQLVLPNPPTPQSSFGDQEADNRRKGNDGPSSLLNAFAAQKRALDSAKYIDFELLSLKDEIYHIASRAGNHLHLD